MKRQKPSDSERVDIIVGNTQSGRTSVLDGIKRDFILGLELEFNERSYTLPHTITQIDHALDLCIGKYKEASDERAKQLRNYNTLQQFAPYNPDAQR